MNKPEQQGFKPNNGGDPASPVQGVRGEGDDSGKLYGQLFHGLTKREHFAAMAMQGILSADDSVLTHYSTDDVAEWAIGQADALLKVLAE